MTTIWIVLTALIAGEALWTLRGALRFRRFFLRAASVESLDGVKWPRTAVLAPCKGRDPHLRENIRSWIDQDYPDFHIVFVVESEEDPALIDLREVEGATVLIAGRSTDCGQKVHNLRYAIEQLPADFDAFAFVDADALVRRDWLKALMSKLLEYPGDAATGYRWFRSNRFQIPGLLRAAWNSSVLTLYEETGRSNFAWGGSMAILRNTFREMEVPRFWEGSLSDDYALTNALRASGRRVHFVPRAMALTADRIGLRSFFSWAGRQLLITRLYFPHLWFQAFAFHLVWFSWIALGAALSPVPMLLSFVFVQVLQGIKSNIRVQCVRSVLPPDVTAAPDFWLASPFIGLANFAMLVGNLFQRRVRWRGVEYEVLGKNRLRRKEVLS